MLNSRAWLQKYLPLLRTSSVNNIEPNNDRINANNDSINANNDNINDNNDNVDTPLVTDSIPLLSEQGSYLFNSVSGIDDKITDMDDWHIIGDDYDWIESDDEQEEDIGLYTDDNKKYNNLSYVPDTDESSTNILAICRDSTEFKRSLRNLGKTFKQRAPYYIPVVQWLPKYQFKDWILADLLTGLAIAAVVIPQGIAYSSLAHVPPVYGLYTAWMPCIIYFLMGTSRQLSIGPEGVISLLTGTAVYIGFNDVSATEALYDYTLPRAAVLTFLVGIFTLLLGILRVGFLDNLISRPILHGFVSASAAIIFVEQLDIFLGFHVSETEWEKIIGVSENLDLINWYSTGIGLISILIIVLLDFTKAKLSKTLPVITYLPTPLIIVLGSILVVWLTGLQAKGVVILEEVEGGFPVPIIPKFWDLKMVESLIVEAVLISIVGFVESNAIAKTYALEHSYEVSANRELVALGTANFAGSIFSAYPGFGSLARSKIANQSGAKTPLFGLVASFIVLITMLFLMQLFYYLPKSAIAAIVMVAAAKLIEFHFGFLWKIRAYKEIFLTLFAFVTTFFLGAELGIVLAIGVSIFLVVKHTTLPSIEVLGCTQDGKWRDIRVMKGETEMTPGILVIRIDESLYFGNVEQIVKMFNRLLSLGNLHAHPTDKSILKEEIYGIVIDARNIHRIDANALNVLKDMFSDYKKRGISICFAHLKPTNVRKFDNAGITSIVPLSNMHSTINSALRYLQEQCKDIEL